MDGMKKHTAPDPTDETDAAPEVAVDAREMSRILGVSRATVYLLANQGRVPSLKVGGAWRFLPSRVIAHLESNPRTSQPQDLGESSEPPPDLFAQPARSHIMREYYARKRGERH